MLNTERLELAGVPTIVRPPINPDRPAPLIILWHGFGMPNSEALLVEALPLTDVQAWKAYIGLPFFGQRLPEGGWEEIMRRQLDDYVLQLLLPVMEQAMRELPNVVAGLQQHYSIDPNQSIGLFGFSAGGMTALLTLIESNLSISVAAIAGVTKDLTAAVSAYESAMQKFYPMTKEQFPWVTEAQLKYTWTQASEAAQQRLNFVTRAGEVSKGNPLRALLLVHGERDEIYSIADIENLYDALLPHYQQANQSERLSLQLFKHLQHSIGPATTETPPEISDEMTELQKTIADWFAQHLTV